MNYVKHYRDLEVYKLSKKLSGRIFLISRRFPREEAYSLTDQIRRSSRSVGAQIAEAWAKRPYPKHFISKLTDADGEQLETQHWISTAQDCNYMSLDEANELTREYESVGRMLSSMMDKVNMFCAKSNRP